MSYVEITKLQYNSQNRPSTDITDQKTWAFFASCIENYVPLKISNQSMGGDPDVGFYKKCRIEYIFNNLPKVREVGENYIMDFSWDITEIQYGSTAGPGATFLTNAYYYDHPQLMEKLMGAMMGGYTFEVNNSNFLLKNPQDDPATKIKKQAIINYVHVLSPGRYRIWNFTLGKWYYIGQGGVHFKEMTKMVNE